VGLEVWLRERNLKLVEAKMSHLPGIPAEVRSIGVGPVAEAERR
jgi:hypothetical protein